MKNKNTDILENLELENQEKLLQEKDVISNLDFIAEDKKDIESMDFYQKEEDIENKKKEDKLKKIFSYIIFSLKYILFSWSIFAVLLVMINYSAYFNIVNSYFFKEKFRKNTESLISSVNASYIKEKKKQKDGKQESLKQEEAEQNKKYLKEYHSINKLIKKVNKDDINLEIEMTPYENRIIIPKIGENIPLIDVKKQAVSWEKELNDIFMKELEKWVLRYPSSAKPWEKWNAFIFGHSSNFPWMEWNYNDVFSLLDNVEFDDEVIVYYWQKKYTYKIKEKRVIRPWDVSILKRNKNKSEITLMTCWPIWTTLNRLIVTWELILNE